MVDYFALPHSPGCYLFLDAEGTILYVGKAKDLRKRVASYFTKADHDVKTIRLLERVVSVDFLITTTEEEALILENNLIKKHQPRYNIDLKDAKRFAYIEMSKEEYPRIGIARRTTGDAVYFGPFTSAAERDAVLKVARRIFRMRSCRKLPKRACLRYHLKSCSGPCVGAISEEDYRRQADNAALFLKGKGNELISSLKEEMAERSARQEFEQALALRNQINAIEKLSERQQVEKVKAIDQDVIAYRHSGGMVFLMVFSFEKGRLVGKQEYSFEAGEEFLEEFLVQYYADRVPPAEIILQDVIGGAVSEYLAKKRGKTVTVTVPRAGDKKKQIDLALTNIDYVFLKDNIKTSELKKALGLPDLPEVIECFDISHLSGTSVTGSMVQFRGGKPDKKNYRRFRIRTVEGIDDLAAIEEVVRRRYRRLCDEGSDLPDLIVIDGGKGQLTSALEVLGDLGLKIPVLALAKKEEDVYLPGEILPRRLDRKGPALRYLQEIRNEAHRFAVAYHTLLRSRQVVAKKSRR
ncbi:MAG: excinuclease ABC subunit C [Methanoregula sp. PtaU1.Bin051]|nr:MAG: excinuclease ABC subunit C [Methanoregula sp. PtaU1.Bin051]